MGLSVAICAMNEEANIARTLESVRWADEIVFVDSCSSDRTCEIAKQYGVKLVVEPWRGYRDQKQYSVDLCTQDWVLLLDADEEVSPGLAEEIRRVINDPEALAGYMMPRKNLFLGKWVRYGGFYPDPKLRLFRRGQAKVAGDDPHERIEFLPGVPQRRGRLKNPLIHYCYPTLEYYLGHMNRYSTLGGQNAARDGYRHFNPLNIVVRPLATFVYNYIVRGGFLDGREGLLLHLYHAGYVSWKYSKAWEVARKK